MKGLELGRDKVRKICEALTKETLEPAKKEAAEIVDKAHHNAEQIIQAAKEKSELLLKEVRKEIEKEKQLFETSILQACKQTLELLRQDIEKKLFNRELEQELKKYVQDPHILAKFIDAVVKAIEAEGLEGDISAYVPNMVSAKEINALILDRIKTRLKEKEVILGQFSGGVKIKLHDENISLDITDNTLKEILGNFLRKDFRDLLFKA